MKVVIEIDKYLYNSICNSPNVYTTYLQKLIREGTPLIEEDVTDEEVPKRYSTDTVYADNEGLLPKEDRGIYLKKRELD